MIYNRVESVKFKQLGSFNFLAIPSAFPQSHFVSF